MEVLELNQMKPQLGNVWPIFTSPKTRLFNILNVNYAAHQILVLMGYLIIHQKIKNMYFFIIIEFILP